MTNALRWGSFLSANVKVHASSSSRIRSGKGARRVWLLAVAGYLVRKINANNCRCKSHHRQMPPPTPLSESTQGRGDRRAREHRARLGASSASEPHSCHSGQRSVQRFHLWTEKHLDTNVQKDQSVIKHLQFSTFLGKHPGNSTFTLTVEEIRRSSSRKDHFLQMVKIHTRDNCAKGGCMAQSSNACTKGTPKKACSCLLRLFESRGSAGVGRGGKSPQEQHRGQCGSAPSFNKGGWHTCHHQAAGDMWADLGHSAGFPVTAVKPAVTFSLVEGLALIVSGTKRPWSSAKRGLPVQGEGRAPDGAHSSPSPRSGPYG